MRSEQFQSSFTAGVVSPDLVDRIDLDWYRQGLQDCHNAFVRVHGGVSNRAGTVYIGDAQVDSVPARLFGFIFSDEDSYVLEFGNLRMQVWRNGGQVLYPDGHHLAGLPVQIVTPWTIAEAASLKFIQSGNVLFVASGGRPLQRITRLDHHDWQVVEQSFVPDIEPPTTLNGYSSATGTKTYRYVVTAVSASGEESIASEIESVLSKDLTDTNSKPVITLVWSPSSGAESYVVYKEQHSSGVFGFIGTATNTSFKDENIGPDGADVPVFDVRNPFEIDHPVTCAFHEERFFTSSGQTVYGSQTANYANFNVSVPAKASDAVTFTPATRQANEIEHIISQTDMVLLGRSGVFRVTGSGDGVAITPSSIRVMPQSSFGASRVAPVVIGGRIIYVQTQGRRIRSLGFDDRSNAFAAFDLTLRANHLFQDATIIDMAWAEEPFEILWCVLSDGRLAGLTYIEEQAIWAWHTHDTQGAFEAVAVVPENGFDVPYFLVRRGDKLNPRRMIERLDSRQFANASDGIFLDSAFIYQGEPVDTLTGLDHLSGKHVSILADGMVHPNRTVDEGALSLENPASLIIVGLAYESRVTSLPLFLEGRPGLGRSTKKQVTEVAVRVQDTRGISVASAGADGVEPPTQKVIAGEPHPLRSELITNLTLGDQADEDAQVTIRQHYPLPMTITSIIPVMRGGR